SERRSHADPDHRLPESLDRQAGRPRSESDRRMGIHRAARFVGSTASVHKWSRGTQALHFPVPEDSEIVRLLFSRVPAGGSAARLRALLPTLTLAQPFVDVPGSVGIKLQDRLIQLLLELNAISLDCVLWESLFASWLAINVGDWRVQYRIDPAARKLVVISAAKRRQP